MCVHELLGGFPVSLHASLGASCVHACMQAAACLDASCCLLGSPPAALRISPPPPCPWLSLHSAGLNLPCCEPRCCYSAGLSTASWAGRIPQNVPLRHLCNHALGRRPAAGLSTASWTVKTSNNVALLSMVMPMEAAMAVCPPWGNKLGEREGQKCKRIQT